MPEKAGVSGGQVLVPHGHLVLLVAGELTHTPGTHQLEQGMFQNG
jgi:hypothetical protein